MTLKYSIITVNAPSIDLPGEWEQSVLVIDTGETIVFTLKGMNNHFDGI
jgi:hypothetical protein